MCHLSRKSKLRWIIIYHFLFFIFLLSPKLTFGSTPLKAFDASTFIPQGGDSRPWPWNKAISYNLGLLDGVWEVTIENKRFFYVIKSQHKRNAYESVNLILEVHQEEESRSCKFLKGIGIAEPTTFRAYMTDGTLRIVRVFNYSDVRDLVPHAENTGDNNSVFVLTIIKPSNGDSSYFLFQVPPDKQSECVKTVIENLNK